MRKLLLGFMVVALAFAVFYLRFHPTKKAALETVYAGSREITLWSTTAQIRSPVTIAKFGERLDVLARFGDAVQVRTAAGVTGWASAGDVLTAEFWQKIQELGEKTASLPVEAHGQTRVIGNLHLTPGRETPRIRQLSKGVAVDLFERQPVAISKAAAALPTPLPTSPAADETKDASSDTDTAPRAPAEPRKEDWWLVRANLPDKTSESGWILGRFIELDIPEPLPDYASAAGMHIAAWFELNRAADTSGDTKAQYLVVGNRGGEGQTCDFTLLRVFTWSSQRQRYETAYVESDACGKLPITLTQGKAVGGDAAFEFQDWSDGIPVNRVYRMHQTIVRRVRQAGGAPSGKQRKR